MSTETPTLPQIARLRGAQTLKQGLFIDVTVAAALVVLMIIPGVDSWTDVRAGWALWLLLIAKSVVQAVAAYLVRRYRDQSGVSDITAPRRALTEDAGDA